MAVFSVVLAVAFNTEMFELLRNGDVDTLLIVLGEEPFYKFFITFIIMLIQNSFTIIPLILIITINYALFGFVNGLLWSWISSVIAAAVWFYGSRYFFYDWVQRKTNPALLSKIEQNGFLFVFQARIFPFVPTSLINIIAGISTIRFKPFILGTMMGNLIFFFVLTLIPAGIMSGNMDNYVLISLTIVLIGVVLFIRLRKKLKKLKESENKFNSGSF
nr:VTT domain-containing protein [Neobacillus sp. Marseille-Q6967]